MVEGKEVSSKKRFTPINKCITEKCRNRKHSETSKEKERSYKQSEKLKSR